MFKIYGFDGDKAIVNVNKGYTSISRINPPEKPHNNYMRKTDRLENIPAGNVDYLEKIIKLSDDYGAKLIFVSFPTRMSWHGAKHNSADKIAKEYGIEFLDLNIENLGINWETETRDGGYHLNNSGARKVSDFLGRYLLKTGLVTDHRNDDKYESWHTAYEKYEKNLAKS
jgi:hypothetical protein